MVEAETALLWIATLRKAILPSVFRFLVVLAVLGGVAVGIMLALVTFVEPEPREITVAVPNSRLAPK